jgi:spermidine/putrescine transport system permease protein
MRALRNVPAIVYLAAGFAFIFLPVVMLFQYSFQDGVLPVPPFKGFSLRWYGALFADSKLMAAMGNSIVVGLLSSAAATVLGFLAAYAMARRPPARAALLQFFLMAPISVSYLIIALGLLFGFNLLGLGKSLTAVIVGHVVINLPLCFAILYSQLGEHQANVERAAQDLGASDLQALLLITVPMLWPALLASFFIAFTLSWDEFVIAFLLSKYDTTMPVVIWSMLRSGLSPKLNAAGTFVFAISVVLVILVEFLLARRRRGG